MLKKQNPNLKIIRADCTIAWPNEKYKKQEGFWDVFGKCDFMPQINDLGTSNQD